MTPTVFGMLRVKNEGRWIARVIHSILPLCSWVFVLDDGSADNTVEICEGLPCTTVYRSEFVGLDESRDKNWLLQKLFGKVPNGDQHYLSGNEASPYWCLAIDGDEELAAGDWEILADAVKGPQHVHSPRILYLWDSPDQVRVDGVYGEFRRPSLFRLMNRAFTYMSTPWGNGANFHCSNIPQELLHHSCPSPARLLHYGYMDKEDRLRKYKWYNQIDPENMTEDGYRHIVQGDVVWVPREAKLKWAGPLRVEKVG
jgi:glycosyltransferase involved in cell wall biosynthesis